MLICSKLYHFFWIYYWCSRKTFNLIKSYFCLLEGTEGFQVCWDRFSAGKSQITLVRLIAPAFMCSWNSIIVWNVVFKKLPGSVWEGVQQWWFILHSKVSQEMRLEIRTIFQNINFHREKYHSLMKQGKAHRRYACRGESPYKGVCS